MNLLHPIRWLEPAKADIRAINRSAAMLIFEGVLHYARTGRGDVRALQGEFAGTMRLRIGDYRVLFTLESNVMMIARVRHRSEAYR